MAWAGDDVCLLPDTIRTHQQVQEIIRHLYVAAKGMYGQQIARELGLDRHTVEPNLCLPQCPERARLPRTPTMLDPYEPYLRQRWANRAGSRRLADASP